MCGAEVAIVHERTGSWGQWSFASARRAVRLALEQLVEIEMNLDLNDMFGRACFDPLVGAAARAVIAG